ncbi:Lysosomal alpha-mannosidase [Amphibalanus amphitrite]|uniref:Alpha-mannosidase n=1 Tax=Amphibalanus amphitrite TaxID=1232801 RepID=A0A6A4VB85_AMPAM|nr:Lysosomal alpha-mannosidase [Amphibalanus amphitrite]
MGHKACPAVKPGMLNVHLVPHTHDDVGWLKTVDQYFYGAKNDIQRAGVQYILDSVVDELVKDPARRFIYVETAFFWRWYREQDEATKATVQTLVNEGRLEFIGGGWSMNDEACAHYNAVIDQMSLGMRTLYDNFGTCGIPRVAWQIDPFGHTKEQVNLFAQMGFDGLFFARIDYDDRKKRIEDRNMEFVWQASHDQGSDGNLFTGVLYKHYSPPPGHCYDVNCNDQPIMDDSRLKDYNVNDKVADFIEFSKNKSKAYRSSHIMMTMGDDFNYQAAHMWFKNLDKLIKYVNARQAEGETVNLLYSTPSCYLKALHDSGLTWPSYQDDFVPYASDPWAYWTGYFTSRAAQKGYIRKSNNVCKQLTALFQTEDMTSHPNRVDILRNAMAINQHHDAVTGTEKQPVADDYVMRLSEGTESCQQAVNDAFSLAGLPKQSFCNQLNTSSCDVTEGHDQFVVTVYNPLPRAVGHWVRVPVTGLSATVADGDGTVVESQLSPIPEEVLRLPGRTSTATYELVFRADDLPPLGFRSYFVSVSASIAVSQHMHKAPRQAPLSNGHVTLDLDPASGRLARIRTDSADVAVNQTFMWYHGYGSDKNDPWEPQHRPTGAYVFNPVADAIPIQPKDVVILEGPLVKEIRHSFAETWVSQVTRLYTGEPYAEIEWQVGPIPTEDGVAKEVISRFTSDISSNDLFYTDSNGRQMMERQRDRRSSWPLNVTEPVSGNYYPVNSRIYIRDAASQLTVLSDRSQGGASLASGQLELMLHRRTVQDDGFGVGEPLNETAYGAGLVVRGRHWVLLSDPAEGARLHRDLAQRVFMAPQLSFSVAEDTTVEEWLSGPAPKQFTGLNALPVNVHLLTLETYKTGQLLIRLEHQYEAGEDPELSQPVEVNLQDLFTTLDITAVEEYGLSADRPLMEINRFDWNYNTTASRQGGKQEAGQRDTTADLFMVTLNPMEIHTFVADFQTL